MEIDLKWHPLPEEDKKQFDEQGYLIVRQALTQREIDTLLEAGDRLIASDRQENRQCREGGRYDGFRNCIAADDAFLPLITHEKILPTVVQLLGAYIQVVTSHLIYKSPEEPGTLATRRSPDWHRDYGRLNHDLGHTVVPRAMLKAAYYLTDLSQPNSGVTMVSPGSNRLKARMEIPKGQADPVGALEPLLQSGDCLIFENRTWHAGAVNLSDHIRKVVMIGYGYRWVNPIDYRAQSPELLEKLQPLERYLLGETFHKTQEYQTSGGESPLKAWCEAYGVSVVRSSDSVNSPRFV